VNKLHSTRPELKLNWKRNLSQEREGTEKKGKKGKIQIEKEDPKIMRFNDPSVINAWQTSG